MIKCVIKKALLMRVDSYFEDVAVSSEFKTAAIVSSCLALEQILIFLLTLWHRRGSLTTRIFWARVRDDREAGL